MTQRAGIICRIPDSRLPSTTFLKVAVHRLMTDRRFRHLPAVLFAFLAIVCAMVAAQAGPRTGSPASAEALSVETPGSPLPPHIRMLRNQSYGPDAQERFDVYLPETRPVGAPVVFMVHGGAWTIGDKASPSVVEHKVERWVGRGAIVVAVNYPVVKSRFKAIEQARAVAKALARAQSLAGDWGADRRRFVLMGHSAGAHLVSLIATSPEVTAGLSVTPWLGTVTLDSGAFDIVQIMRSPRYPRFFDRAFGNEMQYWRRASPVYALKAPAAPLLAVCSTRRADSCAQAQAFVDKAVPTGMRAELLEEDMAHGDINRELGEESPYTEDVEAFIASLDPALEPWFGTSRPNVSVR